MTDFTKKNPHAKNFLDLSEMLETGMVDIPGKGKFPLVGDFTSGRGFEELKRRYRDYEQGLKQHLAAALAKYWRCPQCGKVWPGSAVAVMPKSTLRPDADTSIEFALYMEFVCPGTLPEGGFCRAPLTEVKSR